MTTYHHLYPYPPWGWYGGTQRLRTAIEASRLAGGSARMSWWDRSEMVWREADPDSVGGSAPDAAGAFAPFTTAGLKRRLFPSTLWESGLKPRRGAAEILAGDETETLILHTSYLAPLAAGLRRRDRRVIVDVHDLVFRAHADDAVMATSLGMTATRRVYARSVRYRETRALRGASGLVVTGWDDAGLLRAMGVSHVSWAPVGIESGLAVPATSEKLCVGLIGNFAHSATATAALDLLSSPLAQDPRIQIILAGSGSAEWNTSSAVVALGAVASVDEFYSRIHAAVVPVTNGSGMKCKLAEAALAGKAVITTPLGAAGYPPELREDFALVGSAGELSRAVVEAAVARAAPEDIRHRFDRVVGRAAAATTYAQAIAVDRPAGVPGAR